MSTRHLVSIPTQALLNLGNENMVEWMCFEDVALHFFTEASRSIRSATILDGIGWLRTALEDA